LTIWFIVSRQWWRYAVLSPIILGIYQFIEGSRSTSHLADEIELLQSLPIILGVLTVLFLLSDIVNHRSKIILAYERISKEIELLFDKVKNEDKLYYKRKRFNLLKEKGFDQKSAKQNLNFLLNLRKELLDHLEVKN
jgi:hypothetical protein